MTITLTNPETRESTTVAKVSFLRIDPERRVAVIRFALGHKNAVDEFVETGNKAARFNDDLDDDGNPVTPTSYTQLLDSVPELKALAKALERKAVALGLFDGTVT